MTKFEMLVWAGTCLLGAFFFNQVYPEAAEAILVGIGEGLTALQG